jgi:RNA polymerase sigma-70 factor (ECF subfamily)
MDRMTQDGQAELAPPYDEDDLLARLRAGDKAACSECVERHAPAVYRQALRLMGTEQEAEEVVQETFLSAFKAIHRFEGRSGLSTWLYRIAHNVAMMRLRRSEPVFVPIDDPGSDDGTIDTPLQFFDWCCLPERDFDKEETREELERAIRTLPDRPRSVFILRDIEGLSTEETAEILDLSPEAVRTRLHRARLILREQLSDYFAERLGARSEA